MQTPSIYLRSDLNPWADVPPSMRGNRVPVLYVTDRAPEEDDQDASPNHKAYGAKRSRSAAFGIAEMQIGQNIPWDELVRESRSATRAKTLDLSVVTVRELGRFAPTPPKLVISDAELAQTRPVADPAGRQAETRFVAEISDRLAQSPCKDVFVFVHGFGNTLEDSVTTIGQLWHFMGRPGVAVAYAWPTGVGQLRAYNYSRESGDFTIYHLKQTLRLIASCPDVARIHVIAHSRGTDVASTAIRELHLAAGGGEVNTQRVLKLGTLVLAAADLDIDVVIQRLAAERVGRACQQVAIYVCNRDRALDTSKWLFGGAMRFGDIRSSLFEPAELQILRSSQRLQIIDARVADPGYYGHNYFYSNPAVSSDLILLLRYQLPPGTEYGRPLNRSASGFWAIDDDYPGPKTWLEGIRRAQPEHGDAQSPP